MKQPLPANNDYGIGLRRLTKPEQDYQRELTGERKVNLFRRRRSDSPSILYIVNNSQYSVHVILIAPSKRMTLNTKEVEFLKQSMQVMTDSESESDEEEHQHPQSRLHLKHSVTIVSLYEASDQFQVLPSKHKEVFCVTTQTTTAAILYKKEKEDPYFLLAGFVDVDPRNQVVEIGKHAIGSKNHYHNVKVTLKMEITGKWTIRTYEKPNQEKNKITASGNNWSFGISKLVS